MKGFDPTFADLPDYIIKITKEIWEDRGISTLNDYYAADIVVRSPSGVVVGNQGVIAATMATLAEFPDRRLLGEDVIWSGSPERSRRFGQQPAPRGGSRRTTPQTPWQRRSRP